LSESAWGNTHQRSGLEILGPRNQARGQSFEQVFVWGSAVASAFSFRPIQSLAERGARRILPGMPVAAADYQAALGQAIADGIVTKREQRMLDDLRARVER